MISCSRASSAVRPADALEILPQLRGERLGSRGCGGHGLLARGQCVVPPDEALVPLVEPLLLLDGRRFPLGEQQLHARDLLALIADELLGLEPQLVRALARLDHPFLAARVGVALGVAQ